MLNLCRVMLLLLVTVLTACGGGGGSSGAIPNAGALRTTAGGAVLLPVGISQSYEIQGGVPPYRIGGNTAPALVSALVSGTTLTLNTLAAGSVSLILIDNSGKTVSISVTAGSSTPLTTTAPSPVQIANGATNTYAVVGGRAPYSVTSSDTSVVKSSVSVGALSVTGVGIGSATLSVRDSDGLTVAVTVNVGSVAALLLHAPSDLTLQTGGSQSYLISGGATPYHITSTNPAVATGFLVGTTVTVSALKVGVATLSLTDAQGAEKTIKVTAVADASGAVTSSAPQLRSAGLSSSDGSIAASGQTTLSVTLTDPSGRGIPNQLINFKDESTDGKLNFPEGASGLTNSAGVASVKVTRSSLVAVGAGSISVSYNYRAGTLSAYPDGSKPPTVDTLVSTYVGYQLVTANVSLSNLAITGASGSPLSLAAYGTTQVTVQANLNGVTSSTPIQVNFSATCGQILPTTVSTNSAGVATASYSATDAVGALSSTQGCSGKTVEISASATGAAVLTQTLNIAGAAATNMSFVDATPSRIYLDNSGGLTQSIVRFKLVNSRGEAMQAQDVVLTLKTTNGGVPKASFGTPGNTNPISSTTDSGGFVSVPVFSGSVPTNVLVNAALKSNANVYTDSASLTIASGRPAQARTSLSVQKFSIEGWNFDGAESDVVMSLADRQGNPVPDGTAVNFVTSGGVMIPPVCVTGAVPGDSRCTVKIRSQNPRLVAPAAFKNGYVRILAYAAGEEDFVDSNFNNIYDLGETFTDLGTAFRDDNGSGVYETGEFSVPRAGAVPTAGDGIWGAADVRMQSTIIFATSAAVFSNPVASTSTVSVTIADQNGNSMPTDSVVKATALPRIALSACSVAAGSPVNVANSLDPQTFSFGLTGCLGGDAVRVEISTPLTGKVSSITIDIP